MAAHFVKLVGDPVAGGRHCGRIPPAGSAGQAVAAGPCRPGRRESVAKTVDGYDVRVCVSEAYAADPAGVQSVADALGDVMHGPELGLLSVSITTPADVATACGSPDALACYAEDRIVLPGELRAGSPPLSYLLTHEYGHHILAHSRNDPWPANAWGTKRWATSLGVCPAARRHEVFLGYASMPCEAFAESFAMQQFPMLHMPWTYTDLLAPDDATETAIRADVLHPWTGPTSRRYTGRLGTAARAPSVSRSRSTAPPGSRPPVRSRSGWNCSPAASSWLRHNPAAQARSCRSQSAEAAISRHDSPRCAAPARTC